MRISGVLALTAVTRVALPASQYSQGEIVRYHNRLFQVVACIASARADPCNVLTSGGPGCRIRALLPWGVDDVEIAEVLGGRSAMQAARAISRRARGLTGTRIAPYARYSKHPAAIHQLKRRSRNDPVVSEHWPACGPRRPRRRT